MKGGITKHALPKAFAKTIKIFGSFAELARITGRTPACVSIWASRGSKIPSAAAILIEKKTKGKVKAIDLIRGK